MLKNELIVDNRMISKIAGSLYAVNKWTYTLFWWKIFKIRKKEKWEKFNVKRTLVTDKSMKKSRYKQPLDLYAKSLLPNENLSSAYKFWRSVNPYVSSFFRVVGQKKLKFSRANFMHGSGILHHTGCSSADCKK